MIAKVDQKARIFENLVELLIVESHYLYDDAVSAANFLQFGQ